MRKRQHSFLCWLSCAVLAAASSNRVYLSFLFLKCRARVRLAVMSSFSPPPAAEMSLLPLSSSLPKYFISVSFGDFVPIILAANTPSQPSQPSPAQLSPAQQMNVMWVTRTKEAAENENEMPPCPHLQMWDCIHCTRGDCTVLYPR